MSPVAGLVGPWTPGRGATVIPALKVGPGSIASLPVALPPRYNYRAAALALRGDMTQADDAAAVAQLDTEYQVAVARNDGATMDRILADDFVLVVGSGRVYTKADLLEEARSGRIVYERQDDSQQTVRVWGDTAVLTALLSARGTEGGTAFEYRVWFSDTYVRCPGGWRYVLGQSGARLPFTG